MNRVLIVGASGHGRVVADIVERLPRTRVVGFVDRDREAGARFVGYPVLGSNDELERVFAEVEVDEVIVAIGDNWTRREAVRRITPQLDGRRFATAAHPSAVIGSDVEIGPGSVVAAGAVVNPGTRLGAHVIVNTGARVDHDCQLADFSSIAPGATLGGGVRIGDLAAVSLGAAVVHGRAIGSGSVIGAASLVLRDVPDGVVAYGVPARIVRQREPHHPYL